MIREFPKIGAPNIVPQIVGSLFSGPPNTVPPNFGKLPSVAFFSRTDAKTLGAAVGFWSAGLKLRIWVQGLGFRV